MRTNTNHCELIDLKTDELIPLSQVPKLSFVPRRRGNKRLHISTVFRWAQRGVRGVRLEYVQFGGTKCTTILMLERFLAELSSRGEGSKISHTPSRKLQQEHERAERYLDERQV